MVNISDLFIDNLINLSRNDSFNEAKTIVKKCLLDYLGVTIAGATLIREKELVALHSMECADDCHVIGTSKQVTGSVAALLNGISSHIIELDDGHRIGMLHLGAPIFSALIAVAEKERLSETDFIRGVVIGYEVAIRLACCVQPGCKLRGYHATGTCGTMGAAMGIAAALHYDREQMKSTFSAATTSAAGILEMIEGDTELKPYNAGRAAMDGLVAAYIGKARFKAPEDALGGKRGFLKLMTDEPKLEYVKDFAGDKLMIEGIYMKPYAACRHCHPSIEAALFIRKQEGFDLSKVVEIEVDTYRLAVGGHDHTVIKGANSAKMSIPYSLSVSLATGKAGLDEFSGDYLSNREILALTEKVRVKAVEELTMLCPQKRSAIVKVKTSDGDFCKRVDYPKGEPENPLSLEDLKEKFRGLAMYGGLTLEECEEVIAEIWKEAFSIKKIMGIVCKK